MIFCFLAIFQVLQCAFLIFYVFQCFPPYCKLYSVCVSFSTFFSVSRHLPGPRVYIYNVHVFHCFQQISHPTVCVSHMPWLWGFSPYSRPYSVQSSFSKFFWVFCLCQVLKGVLLIFHVFECFLPYSMSNSVCVSFSTLFSFFTIFQFLQCALLIFHVFHCFLPHCRLYSVFVSYSMFFKFFAKIQVLHCVFLIFHVFHRF